MVEQETLIIDKLSEITKYVSTDKIIKIYGWVENTRDHGGLLFWDLRRDDSILQIVFDGDIAHKAHNISKESVVEIIGKVRNRDPETINEKIENGSIEINALEFFIITEANALPFQLDKSDTVHEDITQKYRYLCLRKGKTRELIKLRTKFFNFIRQYMAERGFLEVNTPIITASSPEGARDFVIPSRLHEGKFYALPQSPQIFKQLLMLSGFDKYFQIAPCFRDEDSRVDRSPCDFYQLDFEMAFPTQEKILNFLQEFIINCYDNNFAVKELNNKNFPIFTFHEAMEKYGTDKPDLRNKVEIKDVTDYFAQTDFKIFKERIALGDKVKAYILPSNQPRSFFDKLLEEWYQKTNLRIAYTYYNEENREWIGPIKQFMDTSMEFGKNGMIFFCQDKHHLDKYMSKLHKFISEKGNFIDNTKDYYCFVIDFPMFEYDPEKKSWDFYHNPFAMGKNYNENSPLNEIIAQQYDLVGNGFEVASGAIRNHDINLFKSIAKKIGYTEERLLNSFPAIMEGFNYGVPPHGGAAPGLERLMMILFDCDKIRDIIPFPLLQNGRDLMMNAPSTITDQHFKELHLIKKTTK